MNRPSTALAPDAPRAGRLVPEERPPNAAGFPILLLIVAGLLLPIGLAYSLAMGNEARVVAGLAGLLGVAVILWQPYWGLVLLVALIYVRLEELVPVLAGLRLTLLISVATLIGAMAHALVKREPLVRNPLVGMLLGFTAVVSFSGFLQGGLAATMEEMAKLALMALLVLNLNRTAERYGKFVTALIFFTTYLAGYSIFLYFTGKAGVYAGVERSQATGIFSDPNDLAAAVIFGLGLALGRLPNCRGRGRLGYVLLAAVMVTAILLTNSRGALVALVVLIGVFCLGMVKNKAAAVIAAIAVLGALLVAAPSRMLEFDTAEDSASSRFDLWLDGLEYLKESPLTGIGFRQYSDQNPDGLTAHNSFVLAFAELGLPGYFFWIGCLYYALTTRRRRTDPPLEDRAARDLFGVRLALVGFLAAIFWLSRTYVQVTWLFIALAVAGQVVTGASPGDFRFAPRERLRDWSLIAGVCVASILGIKVICHLLA